MTDNNQEFVKSVAETIDEGNQDTAALDRNMLHGGRTRKNKKMKALIGLAVIMLILLSLMIWGIGAAFDSAPEEEVVATTAEKEPYGRDDNNLSLDAMKNNITEDVADIKAKLDAEAAKEEEKTAAKEPPATLPPPVVLPPDTQTADNGEAVLTPQQRRLQGDAMLEDGMIAAQEDSPSAQQNSQGDFLSGATFAPGSVSKMPSRQYLLSAATSMSCVLKTKIITSYPGVTMCQLTKDVESDDGSVVLIHAGALLQGEQTQVMEQGIARVFVTWSTVKDGNHKIRIDALGAGSLGASGLPAWIDSHFWDRFKGAILLSLIQDGITAGASQITKQQGNSTVNMNNTENNSREMAELALKNSINIPPTAYVNQGEILTVIVPRDIDFSNVYEVK